MKSILTAVFAAFLITLLAGCNTLQGAGRDLQRAGEELEEATSE